MNGAQQTRSKRSLFSQLAIAVSITVIAVFSASSLLIYHNQRDELIALQTDSASKVSSQLSSSISTLMYSRSIDQYDKLALEAVNENQHHAVVVYDFKLGGLTDQSPHITGYIHDENHRNYRKIKNEDLHVIESAYFQAPSPVRSELGEVLGRVVVFFDDNDINEQLQEKLVHTLSTSLAMALFLITILLYLVKRLFITPLTTISRAFANQDTNGIPNTLLPDFNTKELSSFSHSVNNMLSMIRQSHQSIWLEHSRLLNVIEGTRTGTWEWNIETGKITYDGAWQDIIGWSNEVLNGEPNQDWKAFIHSEDRALSDKLLQQLFEKEINYYDCELRLKSFSGEWIHVLGRANVVEWDEHEHPLTILGTLQNITAHKKAEESLKLAAKVFTHSQEGIIITDRQSNIIDVNQSFTRITGYSIEEVRGKKPSILHSGHQDADFYQALWKTLEKNGHWSGEIWNRKKSGEIYPELLTISCVRDADRMPVNYVAVFSDITSYKEHERKLEKIAHFDTLTKLPNRFLLADRLKNAMKHAKRQGDHVAVIFLDLDGFKPINDIHGHKVGDILLQELAKRMQLVIRESDTIARIGGDEFVAVLTGLHSPEDCHPLLPRLLKATSDPVSANGHYVQVSASLGITIYPQAEEVNADKLIRQADHAMYQAKLEGKHRYHFFDAELERTLKRQNEYIRLISTALFKNEFFLVYQPKVNFRTGDIIGLEALIRWQHPKRGKLMPIDFIPSIENHRLIVEMGNWVLEAALKQLSDWKQKGLVTQVSVNIAPLQLLQPDFISHLESLLARYPHIAPSQLQLEILETSALEDVESVSRIITYCQSIGVSFAIDDFGTGYASLTYLKQLPAQTLKIDQSFIGDMLNDSDNLAILEGVITLANTFKRSVLAEGVESIEQIQLLLWLGCEYGQGYGISKPLLADKVLTWMTQWQPDPSWLLSPEIKDEQYPLIDSVIDNRARAQRLKSYLADRKNSE
ncbi:sensor domain-containing protein [Enterovibrio calviensis]|uniref:sensor domain-containing protein n=1 Tax=Enterovibrio calviensis TaxID=91359 RepID=UPI00048222B4|nr:GGDEF domain-containing phosphodiesterase [Enterovibrio calviensis]